MEKKEYPNVLFSVQFFTSLKPSLKALNLGDGIREQEFAFDIIFFSD